MATRIDTWQIIDDGLTRIETSLSEQNRTEPAHLETWIASNPEIVGSDISIIGRQVSTASGFLDLLGIDRSGNLVVIELKRDKVARDAIAQAIDYASDVAEWTIDKISDVCYKYHEKTLEDHIGDVFPEINIDQININDTQRIILVGFYLESSSERMIAWLSGMFGVNINAVLLSYVKTSHEDELLTRTSIISEDVERLRTEKRKKFSIKMSDVPGEYSLDELKERLSHYFNENSIAKKRIKDVLLSSLLTREKITRDQFKELLIKNDPSIDPGKAGYYLISISSQLGMEKNDFLRQIINYEYTNNTYEKNNFSLNNKYREVVQSLFAQ